MAPNASPIAGADPNALKLAVAVALLRFKNHHHRSPPPPSSSSDAADAQRWKQKAKDRKREIVKLREELKHHDDAMQRETLPEIASCRCHFFDGCGDSGIDAAAGHGEHWIDEVMRRRFMRLVRWKERRRKPDGSIGRRQFLEFGNGNEIERLGTSIDFLVELSNTIRGGADSLFATFSHQAVDFILASTKNLLLSQEDSELIEETVNGLITRLTKRMSTITESDGSSESGSDSQFCVQHLLRKLGNEPYIGQRIVLLVSQKISIAAENLLFVDPFDEAFLANHDSMFMMIQLMELLILDNMRNWTAIGDFDRRLFEEWVRSVLQARKSLTLLECRNGLYVLYMERVVGELAKLVGPLMHQGKLDLDILSHLFH